MPLSLLSQIDPLHLENVRLVATDMDGTLTIAEKFSPELLQALIALKEAGRTVVIVTRRSAGWVSGLVHYLPVAGAICENGGFFYRGSHFSSLPPISNSLSPTLIRPKSAELSFNQGNLTSLLVPISDFKQHRQELADLFQRLQAEFPHIQESDDNQFRLTDWTFDVAGVTEGELQQIGDRCREAGWDFTYSTVQCHLKLAVQSKAAGLKQVLRSFFLDVKPEQVLTVGDSPNDESLFDPALFPLSVGVANVRQYCDRLAHQPTYITPGFEGKGFCELAQLLTISKRSISREDLQP